MTIPMPSNVPLHGAVDLAAVAAAREAEAAATQRASNGGPRVVIDVTEATFEADVINRSQDVPVIVDFWASWCGPCKTLSPILEKLAADYQGKIVLAKVDCDAEQQVAAAFRVQSIPSVFAVLKGQVLPLFQGALPEVQVKQFLEEVLKVAAEHGVTGTAEAGSEEPVVAAEPAEDPRWDDVSAAIETGEWDRARALLDALSVVDAEQAAAARGQVELLARTDGVAPAAALAAADADPMDLAKAAAAADVELLSGQADAAFERLLVIIRATAGAPRDAARTKLVELFALVGEADPAVKSARMKLASALF